MVVILFDRASRRVRGGVQRGTLALGAAALVGLSAAACAGADTAETSSSTPSAPSSTSHSNEEPSREETPPPSQLTAEEPSPVETRSPEPAPIDQAAEPTVVECLPGTPGPARWSDGTIAYSEWCFQEMGGPAYLEAERNANAGGAAVTGYGTAPNGNRNPSSGELQTQYGCQQGRVDDPALCAAVEEVIRAADPEGTLYKHSP